MKRIGKYRILGLLGRGGMGAVYKAAMPVTGRIVAVKWLRPTPFLVSLMGMKAIERAFAAEARALGSLSHPHVAAVWDYGRCGGRPYFVMEYFCRDLGQVIGESPEVENPTRRLPLPRAAGYALQTLSGLARLHHAGIVHRDIKPFNLLLDADDRVKITDFGLSRVRGESPARVPGLKVGSPFYAAPEQEDDPDRAGPRADLYALGVTLYRMITGLLPVWPLDGPNLPSVASRDLDQDWDAFFRRALDPDPAGRHADAAGMANELTGLLDRWRKRLERACSLAGEEEPPRCPPQSPRVRPRSEPVRTGVKNALEALGLDPLGRPACYAEPWLALSSQMAGQAADQLVLDEAAGLCWQAGGSPWPLDMREAREYVAGLSAQGHGGWRDWRLPTVEELSYVLTPAREFTGHCLPPVFDPAQRLLWSADRRSFTQAWYADAELGAFSFADLTCRRSVRAVRTIADVCRALEA